MTRAEQRNITSRRSFLAVAAASTAILAPNIAPAAQGPDAELIALGRQLDVLRQEYASAIELFRPKWDEHSRLMKKWDRDNPSRSSTEGMAEYYRLYASLGLTELEKNGPDPDGS